MWTSSRSTVGSRLLLAWGWGRRAALVYLLLGLAFAWYPFLYLRLDLLSVHSRWAGIALVRRRSPRLGGALLGDRVLRQALAARAGARARGAAVVARARARSSRSA